MASVTVSDRESLLREIKAAQPGDAILLEPGVYSDVSISNVKIAGDVTIMSRDPGAPAVITDLTIKNSSGLNFSNIEFAADWANGGTPLEVFDSKDIHFDGLNVHGSLDNNPSNDGNAMMIRNSSDVSVTNSEFQQFANGIAHLDSNNLLISGNSIHDLRMDGIRGGGSSNVTITKNFFTDFFRQPGDHPDAIQFWNSNTSASTRDITVSENVFARGEGGPIQGIFITAQITKLPYLNVTVTDNVMVGTMYHGITVAGAQGALISGNIVAGAADMNSRITVDNSTGVTLTNNQATQYILDASVEFAFQWANEKLATPTDGGLSLLKQWSFAHEAVSGGLQALIATSLDAFIPPTSPVSPTTWLPGGPDAPIVLPFDLGQFAFSFF